MSGQYPPNSTHPFSRGTPLQRGPPSQSVLPPWGQPTGMNMMSGGLNFYRSPHTGRGQPWVPPQSHAVRPAGGNPLWLMTPETSQRIPSEYQQVETMDLSSHSSTPPPVLEAPKMMSARSENSDSVRNGAISEVNGETERTAVSEQDSIMTSVIAANPLRETFSDALHCSKVPESPVVRRLDSEGVLRNFDSLTNVAVDPVIKSDDGNVGLNTGESFIEDSVLKTDNSDTNTEHLSVKTGYNNNSTESSVLKIDCSDIGIESNVKTDLNESNRLDDISNEIDRIKEDILNSDGINKSVEEFESSQQSMTSTLDASQSSVLDSSSLSVNTDDSKLVIAESSAEDIFGISPVGSSVIPTSQETEKTESSETSTLETVPEKALEAFVSATSKSKDQWPASKPTSTNVPVVADSEPTPSVENVEILLESMFNSQEETSCSSQNSNSSVPQSVIVSSAGKPLEALMDINTPMKEEELAMTLAEDTPTPVVTKNIEEKEETIKDYLMDEIEKKLEMLTDSSPCQVPNKNDTLKPETPLCESVKQESCSIKDVKSDDNVVVLPKQEKNTEDMEDRRKLDVMKSVVPDPNTEPGLQPKSEPGSSNPFIEVESELEKMFAGIVESTDDTVSESVSRPSVSETKKPGPPSDKKPIPKRKKSNSQRPSDNSVFGGSSTDSTPVKKRGRKRKNDSGSEKGSKKIKIDGEHYRKGKVVKDSFNDSFSSKVKGPFVHIEGSKESPASVVVVNSGARADDEDGSDKISAKRKHSSLKRSEARRPGPAYSSSTLSMRYNSDTADLSWVCVFCKRGPHCAGGLGGEAAGDLFGPYRVPATPPTDDVLPPGTPSDREVVEEQKKLGGRLPKSIRASGTAPHFVQKMAKKSKRSVSGDGLEAGLLTVEGGYEVWLHSQCAEWAPGLCVISTTLVGLEDAVWTALRTKCSHCGDSGAGIGCVVRSCPARVHYPCAKATGWLLDTDTFIARCHLHRTRLRPS